MQKNEFADVLLFNILVQIMLFVVLEGSANLHYAIHLRLMQFAPLVIGLYSVSAALSVYLLFWGVRN